MQISSGIFNENFMKLKSETNLFIVLKLPGVRNLKTYCSVFQNFSFYGFIFEVPSNGLLFIKKERCNIRNTTTCAKAWSWYNVVIHSSLGDAVGWEWGGTKRPVDSPENINIEKELTAKYARVSQFFETTTDKFLLNDGKYLIFRSF